MGPHLSHDQGSIIFFTKILLMVSDGDFFYNSDDKLLFLFFDYLKTLIVHNMKNHN